jgi:tRNA uridine 5-carbamoylmethylation protein Kti12
MLLDHAFIRSDRPVRFGILTIMQQPQPTLILFCGLPGSGKATLAKQLEKQGRGIRICTDDWQDDLKMNHNDNGFHEKLQKRLYAHALRLTVRAQMFKDVHWVNFSALKLYKVCDNIIKL